MKHGFYRVKFTSNKNMFGEGIVVVRDGTLNGGDHGYVYSGRYQIAADSCSANVLVQKYNQSVQSVFGPRSEFKLGLTGRVTEEAFTLTGQMAGNPENQITLSGAWFAPIAE